jgi:mRNA-degrading endonuclease RelE of RelBE toxin-antitoxin system
LKVELHPDAEKELDRFKPSIKKKIKAKLRELEEQPTGHEDSDLIKVKGRNVFKYKMKNQALDHRAVYNIIQNTVYIYTIFHRDQGYEKTGINKRF